MDRCRAATAPGVQASFLHRLDKPWCRGDDDSELDVFAAERYFNGDDALWCARSSASSSSFSSAFRTGTHDRSVPTPTAATSSSEANWNSRSALLPDERALAVAAVLGVEASRTSNGCDGRKPTPSTHRRPWLFGVAGCACAGGDGEESVSADKCRDGVEADKVLGADGKTRSTEAVEPFPRTESAFEKANAVRVRPGRWLDDGDAFLAEASPFEFSTPILKTPTAATSDERRRRSLQMFRPVGDQKSALGSATQSSAFTIVAGSTAWGGAARAAAAADGVSLGGPPIPCGSPGDSGEDDAAPGEELIACGYPPSEVSVVWSVVTADGATSGNFSSAASGCDYSFNDGENKAVKSNRKRRSGITKSGGLLTCLSEKAVDAIGSDRSVHRPEVEPAAVARLGAAAGGRNRRVVRGRDAPPIGG